MTREKTATDEPRKLYKSRRDKYVDGVCAGFSDYFGIDVTLVRVVWLASLFAGGLGFWAYVAAMIFMPKNPEHEILTESEKKKHHPGYIWGAALIVFGVLLLSDRWDMFQPWNLHHRFMRWGLPYWSLGDIFPFLLVAGGIAYLFYAMHHKSRDAGSDTLQDDLTVSGEERRFRRTVKDRWLGGVLNGLAVYLNVDVVIVRIAFIAVAAVSHPFFLALVYIGLWVAVPEETL